jgi:hypothetical protein
LPVDEANSDELATNEPPTEGGDYIGKKIQLFTQRLHH